MNRARCQPALLRCLLCHAKEIAMATVSTWRQIQVQMHEVWLFKRPVVHLAVMEAVKCSFEVGQVVFRRLKTLYASLSRTAFRSYNINLFSHTNAEGSYKTQLRFYTWAISHYPSWPNIWDDNKCTTTNANIMFIVVTSCLFMSNVSLWFWNKLV